MFQIILYGFFLYLGIYICQRLIRSIETRCALKDTEKMEEAERLLAQFDKEKKS